MKKILFSICTCLLAISAFAQIQQDPRPLTGLKKESLPPLVSFQEIAKHAVPGGVLRSAQYVGKAQKEPLEIVEQGTIARPSDQRPSPVLWKVLRATNGTVNWMWRLGKASTSQRPQAVKPVSDMLVSVKDILHILDPNNEFVEESDNLDELGIRHLRFQQIYKGIPVWKRDLYVHLDRNGDPSIINGAYEPSPIGVNVEPSLTKETAIATTVGDLKNSNHWAENDPETMRSLGIAQPAATLVLYPEGRTFRLAYDVDVHPNLHEHFSYLVDALSGEIIHRIPLHCSLVPSEQRSATAISSFAKAAPRDGKLALPLAGFANSSGADLNGTTRNFRTYQHTDNQYYMVWDLASYNAAGSTPPNDLQGGGLTLDLKNKDASSDAQLFHVMSSNNTWSDPSSVSAHSNMGICYEYYRSTFSRNAIDGSNGTIISIVHTTENGQSMGNAYWNGKLMLYGDGDNNFKPLAGGLDVAAHEMTHGVTGNSADLLYEFQSGALNESFSDVFGVMIDNNDLTIGEDVIQPGHGTCLRNMENPADPNALSPQPGNMNDFRQLGADQDNGGVHINSGIPNHAAAIIINAIGRQKAQQIYYKALTSYLTRSSQFIDCRLACESAAKDLYGAGSNELQAVSNGFADVGIGGSSPGDNQDDVPAQTGGSDFIVFIASDNRIGFLVPSTGEAFLFSDQFAVARVTNTANGIDRCQLSTPRTGKNIWFVDPAGHLAFIESATGTVFNYPNLFIQQAGDVWNASVSPDEEYVSIASAYVNDPNIYIFDGEKLVRIELLPQAPDAPSPQETIQYPDVMSWSPNKWDPRIAFDAFNEEDLAGSTISYWSMYEINFSTQKIYSLIPAQPQDINIGNVTYSKTDPDIIAFNVIDQTASDIWVGNFETGDIFPLQIPTRTINSVAITDGDRPSFSPNDRYICFSSAANNAICYFDGTNGAVSYLAFVQPFYNPHWFLAGGSAGVHRTAGHFFSSLNVYPSVTNRQSTLRFSLKEDAECSVEVINVLGASVRLFSGKLGAGEQEIAIDLNKLAAGAYLVRLTDGTHQAFTKLVIE